jgi:hypothetical protein
MVGGESGTVLVDPFLDGQLLKLFGQFVPFHQRLWDPLPLPSGTT